MKTYEGIIKMRIACSAASCKKTDAVGPGCLACDKASIFALDRGSHVIAELAQKPAEKPAAVKAKKAAPKKAK